MSKSVTQVEAATMNSYLIGFGLSIVLTVAAYVLAVRHAATATIIALALTQFAVQAVCFLHVGRGAQPRWKLGSFGGMLGVVLILVFGSLWIMHNLNYHMMTPKELKTFMHVNEGL